jgi:diguanylate cyclase (GGDEF)-like protein/PAS domain S-box-containing protein
MMGQVELLDEAVIARGSDGVISAWSSGAERLYGYSANEAVGRSFDVLVPGPRRGAEREVGEGTFRGDLAGRYETVRVRKDGATIQVSVRISPITDSAGAIGGVSTIEHQIVANGRAGTWTLDAEPYLRSAFDDAPIGIAVVSIHPDRGGRFLQVNRALCELTGYTAEELEATGVAEIIHADDIAPDREAMARLAAGELEGFQLEQRLMHSDRHVVWVMVSASVVRDVNGSPLYCIRQLQDIEERKRFEGELGYLVDHDPLTGLLNRRGFVRDLTHQIADARRYGGGGAVLFLDLDDFKFVNDTLGHSIGDEVISDVARVIFERLRETDAFARLGGDEFAILLPHAGQAEAQALAVSLREAVRNTDIITPGVGRRVTISIGITSFNNPGEELTADDILIDADLAMYAAKDAGKDRVAVSSAAIETQMVSRVTWTERVAQAARKGLFELHCQPIFDLATEEISQWELLLRLPGEHGELILPAQFLYTAERSGSILEIDRWVLTEAIRLIAEHRNAGRGLRLHVNLSGRSVGDPELPAFIEQQLAEAAIDPASLVLEVTETAAIANMDRARRFATKLTGIGCLFALDDFGAGFGSFYYLKYIPFDYVKIDGEFIGQLPASSTDQLILDSIVQMSTGLGKRTIAEFAGGSRTIEILKKRGVDYAQGYYLGRPTPVTETLAV